MSNQLIQEVLSQINTKAEKHRQYSQELRLSMYLDDYETEVTDLLRAQFHKDNYKRLYPMLASYYNLFKKIVNIKSVIYKREAQRKWYRRDGKSEDENYAELIQKTNINTNQQLANKLTNVNNTSLVRIIPYIDNREIQYEAIPSELISITQNPDKPSEIRSLLHMVVIQDSYSKLSQLASNPGTNVTETAKYISKYFYWDKENYVIFDSDLKEVMQPNNPNNLNPYDGIIPYVLFKNLPSISGSIWNETVNHDLYRGTLQVNVLQTYLNNALKLTGYRQPYMTGIDADEAKKLDERVSDGLQPMAMSSKDAKFGTFELTGSVDQLKDCLHDIISEIADNHGVSFNSRTTSAQKQSAAALGMELEQLNNMREEQWPLYRESEEELARKTILIANKDIGAGIDIEGKFSINFFEEEAQIGAKDKLELNKFHLKSNLKSLVDLYKEIDADCTDDKEAEKRINTNKEINDKYRDILNLTEEPTEPEPDDSDEEE